VIVFVAASSGRRYAFVGDLAWQREGITEREERPWLTAGSPTTIPPARAPDLLAMAAVVERFPEIALVPAHDRRAFDSSAAAPLGGLKCVALRDPPCALRPRRAKRAALA
jgi:hypothetical protein